MILSGQEIKNRNGTDLLINPFNEEQVNPNSYDIRIDNELVIYTNAVLDCRKDNETKEFYIDEKEGFMLEPGKLYLASSIEYTEARNVIPVLDGKSSLGRLGVGVHITAGFGDVGFRGHWTLEISVKMPVIIYPFMRFAQLRFHEITGNFGNGYNGKYQDNTGVQSSFCYKNFRKE